MFENIANFFKRFGKNEKENSKNTAKERLHLVLAQDRANISADFLEMMKQEIIEVIKKYIDIDEEAIDVRMTNKPGEDGIVGAPALYANIPIVTIKNEARKLEGTLNKEVKANTEKEVSTQNEKEEKEVVEEKGLEDTSEKDKAEEVDSKDKEQEDKESNLKEEQIEKQEDCKIQKNEKVEIKANSEKYNKKEKEQKVKGKNNSNTKNKKSKGKRG